jgi:hypothetical protein
MHKRSRGTDHPQTNERLAETLKEVTGTTAVTWFIGGLSSRLGVRRRVEIFRPPAWVI